MSAGAPKRKVLVVEESPGDQRRIAVKLAEASAPWVPDCRGTLAGALEALALDRYDCLLVGLDLPDAPGMKAVRALRRHAPEIALVILTDGGEDALVRDALRAGAQDYVEKSPSGLAVLPRVIRHAIERQQAGGALEASRRTTQALLDASHDMALLLDAEGVIVIGNAQAADELGLTPDALVGQPAFELMPAALAERRRRYFRRALESGTTVVFEDNDGLRWFANRMLAVAGAREGEKLCALFCRDITSERVAAVKLEEAKEEADLANRAKTEFMSRMSRDIRTPLNDVIGFAEMMSCEMLGAIQPPVYKDYAANILNSGTQILRLIDHITDVSMLESALIRDQSSYRDLVELSPDLICVCIDGVITRINAAGLGMLRAPSAAACEGRRFAEFIHPDYRTIFEIGMEALYEEEHPVPVKIVTMAGRMRDVELSAVPIRREGQAATLLVGRDTTEITAAMRAVAAREQRIRAIMDTVLDGIITIDEDGVILNANLSVERIFGYPLSELVGGNITQLMPESEAGRHTDYIRRFIETGTGTVIGNGREVMARHRDGRVFPVHLAVAELRLDQRRMFTGTIRDLTENKELAQRVAYLANHDPLTDLPNRTLLLERLSQQLASARGEGLQVVTLTIDLDGFTTVNDSLGHDFGNAVLRETARRLSQAAGKGGVAARLAADEFAMIVPVSKDLSSVTQTVETVRAALARPFGIQGTEIALSADMGVSVFPRDGDDAVELLRNAEMALHAVKRCADQTLGFFDAAMSFAVSERLTLERSLNDALRTEQFELFYQPQVHLANGTLVGAEALIRWRHPELGLISPDKFIPVAEETGLIVPIGAWVLRTACAQLRRWQEQGAGRLRLGINISGRQFREPGLVETVADAIAESGVEPALVDLELTESMLMADGEGTLKVLRELATLGVALSIDDFGTGYSSLAYLKRFPVNTIKIDRAFVRDLDHDEDGRAIAHAIISLAHSLSMKTVAEGVETETQAMLLKRHGCDEIQGYMIGRPMPASDFLNFALSFERSPLRAAAGTTADEPQGV